MEQMSVNQRVKFLIEQMGLSARAFSEAIDESPTNTHNYIGKRNSMPGADYLEKILSHFDNINPIWLITGKGEPFLIKGDTNEPLVSYTKNNYGNSVGNNRGTVTQHGQAAAQAPIADGTQAKLEAFQREVEFLRAQLASKDALIASQQETIDLLKTAFTRPN